MRAAHPSLQLSKEYIAATPDPDYSDSEDEQEVLRHHSGHAHRLRMTSAEVTSPAAPRVLTDQLTRELTFNQKIGKKLLGQKSELQRAMERHRDQQQRRQAQHQLRSNRSSFERALEQRMSRAAAAAAGSAAATAAGGQQQVEGKAPQEEVDSTPEFLRVHARLRSKVNAPS